jgi:chloramphenicol O-acetyltransferase type A
MNGAYLNLADWKRRGQYEFYRHYELPFFSVCRNVRVSGLHRAAREPGGPSFFLGSLYLSLCAANRQEEFRLRIRPEGVWRHDRIHGGSAVLRSNETFGFAYFEFLDDYKDFQTRGRAAIDRVEQNPDLLEPHDQNDAIIHYSVLPWIQFTAFTNARRLGTLDSVPKIVFGRYFESAGEIYMPVSVEVHHALVDGLHVARFFDDFEAELNHPERLSSIR